MPEFISEALPRYKFGYLPDAEDIGLQIRSRPAPRLEVAPGGLRRSFTSVNEVPPPAQAGAQ